MKKTYYTPQSTIADLPAEILAEVLPVVPSKAASGTDPVMSKRNEIEYEEEEPVQASPYDYKGYNPLEAELKAW